MLGSEAVDGAVLHTQGRNPSALSSLHHQIHSKVLHEIVTVVAKGLCVGGRGGGGERRRGEGEREGVTRQLQFAVSALMSVIQPDSK